MASLAELSKVVGFFSYSREDDEDFRGELSAIRAAIGRNLAALLGRKKRQDFDLWQDVEAIAAGKMWGTEIVKAIEESVFFIPIVTPRAVQSPYCRDEFEAFPAREKALGRNDLVFPILYIPVPALRDEAKRRSDRVLSIVAERQFEDWSSFGYEDINSPACRQKIRFFCEDIVETLHETWISPEERLHLEVEAKRRAEEEERVRQEAVAKRQAEERARLCKQTQAKKRAEREAREREQAEAGRRAEEEERLRQEAEVMRLTTERKRLLALVKYRADEEARKRDETYLATERKRLLALVKNRAGKEVHKREETEAKKRAEEEERERLRKEGLAKNQAPLTAAQELALKPGDSFKEGADCPEMIVLPAGQFLMGSPEGQGDKDEHPQHEVTMAKPFAVAKFALTFDEWDACTAKGGCRRDVSDEGWGRGRRPVINVSWDDAKAYVEWLSGVTGKLYRLLSEAEYEYAARAGSATKYPWGEDAELNGKPMAKWGGCTQTVPVGSFPANAFGLRDIIGNVWEWTEDCWNENYRGAPRDGSVWTSSDWSRRVVRGGSWYSAPHFLRAANRGKAPADGRIFDVGFRVARTLAP